MARRYHATALLLGATLAAALVLLSAGVTATLAPQEDHGQVVKFSHKQHVKDAGVECRTCHDAAWTSLSSADNLRGSKAVSATCHNVEDAAECTTCHPENTAPAKFPNPVRDVLFPHATHVGTNDSTCLTCHAGIDQAGQGVSGTIPSMNTCSTCHDDRHVSNACEACHTNFAMMLPPDHRLSGFVREHRNETRLGVLTVECRTCHAEPFCQECHQGAGLKAFSPRDLQTDAGPKRSTQDSPDQTVLQNVHALNYRFTHGIDAKSREAECSSCHASETFCAECHAAGTNLPGSSIRPASHNVAGFASLAPGARGDCMPRRRSGISRRASVATMSRGRIHPASSAIRVNNVRRGVQHHSPHNQKETTSHESSWYGCSCVLGRTGPLRHACRLQRPRRPRRPCRSAGSRRPDRSCRPRRSRI